MKFLTQFELNNISAGVNQGYGSSNNSGHKNQSQAGLFTDVTWVVFSAAVTWFATTFLEKGYRDRKERENKNNK